MASEAWSEEDIAELRANYHTMGSAGMENAGMCSGRDRKLIWVKAKNLHLKVDQAALKAILEAGHAKSRETIKTKPARKRSEKKRKNTFRPAEPRFASVWSYAKGVQA